MADSDGPASSRSSTRSGSATDLLSITRSFPTRHALLLHSLVHFARSLLRKVVERHLRSALDPQSHQQAGHHHSRASLASLAVDHYHVGRVLRQPLVALVENGAELRERAGVVVLDTVVRVAAAEAQRTLLRRVVALFAEVETT